MAALAVALTGDQPCVDEMKSEFEDRVRYLHQRLNDLPGVVCPEPERAIFVFPDVSGTYERLGVSSSVEWATRLLEEAHVSLVPGAAFGADRWVRFSFATSRENLQQGLDRWCRFWVDGRRFFGGFRSAPGRRVTRWRPASAIPIAWRSRGG